MIMNSKFKIQNSKLGLTLIVALCVCSIFGTAPTNGAPKAQAEKGSTPKVDTVVVKLNAPKVSGMVEPDSIGIGDRFLYTIEVE